MLDTQTDNKKISFIVSISDETEFKEAALYLNKMRLPEGYTRDIIPIYDCKSMAQAYNQAMNQSDAKYKIYFRQDVMIINPNFLSDILTVFSMDSKIGMLGVVGAPKLSKSGILSYSQCVGNLYSYDNENIDFKSYAFRKEDGYTEVECVSGLIMVTSQDLPWREDLFDGDLYYDLAQSFEFRKHGYKVVVPNQLKPWCIDDKIEDNVWAFDTYRKIFVDEYLKKSQFMAYDWKENQ